MKSTAKSAERNRFDPDVTRHETSRDVECLMYFEKSQSFKNRYVLILYTIYNIRSIMFKLIKDSKIMHYIINTIFSLACHLTNIKMNQRREYS